MISVSNDFSAGTKTSVGGSGAGGGMISVSKDFAVGLNTSVGASADVRDVAAGLPDVADGGGKVTRLNKLSNEEGRAPVFCVGVVGKDPL
jgi:hypothetical protein